jgi:hypothetical protein
MRHRLVLGVGLSLLLASGCSKSPEASRDDYLKSADAYLAANKVSEAIIEYKNAVEAELKRRGLNPRPDTDDSFIIKDPDGNILSLTSR